jgi:elongation factor G
LDAIVDYLPSPKDIKPVQGYDPADHENIITREANDKEPFCAYVFKIMSDPYVGKLSYIRVYSGHIKSGDQVYNVWTGKKERINRFLRMHANSREEISDIYTGDIAAVVGLKNAKTGDTLTVENAPVLLEKLVFPDPVISMAIEPKTKADQDKLLATLARLEEEDPTFLAKYDEDTGQMIISGMGELHLEIIVDRLMREFGIKVNVGKPQVTYKETITRQAEYEAVYEKQVAGKDLFARVCLSISPGDQGAGLVFQNIIKADAVPEIMIKAIESGLSDAMQSGVLAGYRMDDIKVVLTGGLYDELRSTEASFRIAANIALKEAVRRGHPTLMEPVMKLEVVCPDDYTGDIINDFNSRRGKIENIAVDRGLKVISGLVPMSEIFGYATSLRSMSQGRASHTLQFSHYSIVPIEVSNSIVGRIGGQIF